MSHPDHIGIRQSFLAAWRADSEILPALLGPRVSEARASD